MSDDVKIVKVPNAIQAIASNAWAMAVKNASKVADIKAKLDAVLNGDQSARAGLLKLAQACFAEEKDGHKAAVLFRQACTNTEGAARIREWERLGGKDKLAFKDVPTVAELCPEWADAKSLAGKGLEELGAEIVKAPTLSAVKSAIKSARAARTPEGNRDKSGVTMKVNSEKLEAVLKLFAKEVSRAVSVADGDAIAQTIADATEAISVILNQRQQTVKEGKPVDNIPTVKAA